MQLSLPFFPLLFLLLFLENLVLMYVWIRLSSEFALIMLLILASLHRTKYILKNKELTIKTTKLIGEMRLYIWKLQNLCRKQWYLSVSNFLVQVFTAGLHISGLGRVFLSITDFKDGLSIRTDHGNYIITPSNPLGFKEAIGSRIPELENINFLISIWVSVLIPKFYFLDFESRNCNFMINTETQNVL